MLAYPRALNSYEYFISQNNTSSECNRVRNQLVLYLPCYLLVSKFSNYIPHTHPHNLSNPPPLDVPVVSNSPIANVNILFSITHQHFS